MKTIATILILHVCYISVYSQEDKCDCTSVYKELVQKVEENYIGLALMNDAKKRQYNHLKEEFAHKVDGIKPEDCTQFLQNFLSFFSDEHLFVYERPKYSEQQLAAYKTSIKNNVINVESILQTLEFEKDIIENNGLDGIIGKWTDGESELAIIKDEGYYKAYILNSKHESVNPGELKAIFKASKKGFDGTYYSYSYEPRYVEGDIYKEKSLLVLTGGLYWGKVGSLSNREIAMINKDEITLPTIQKIDDKNTLFSIPSFLADYNKFIKVITDNIDVLKNTTNLIIDVRGNVGGNAIYFSFIDAYATHTLKGGQGLVLASKETQKYFDRLAKNSPDIYQPVVDRINQKMGEIIDGPKYKDKQFPPFESKIQNVAILSDNGSMSAAESFILHSQGSSNKVTTFGSPTGGVIDYTSINTIALDSGNQNIYFGYPTSTYHKNIPEKGYNSTGIIPDVMIKDSVMDKVNFILDYYIKLKK